MEEIKNKCNAISYTVSDSSISGLENMFTDIAKNVLKIKVDEEPIQKKTLNNIKIKEIINKITYQKLLM